MDEFVAANDVDPNRWNQRILSLNGPMQLTFEWASFVCATDNVHSLFWEGGQHDDTVASIIYLSASSRWPLSRWPSASADCIPLGQDRNGVLAELELALRSRGISEFQLNSFAYDGASPIELAPLGYIEVPRYEFVLALDLGTDAVWRGIRSTLRHDVRHFNNSGISCRERSDRGVVAALYSIEQETVERHRAQGRQRTSMREGTYRAFWEILVRTGRASVYLAEKDGVPISSVVIGRYGGNAYYLYGGATPAGLAVNAPKGLLWFAIQTEYEHGVREFNLGGMPASAVQPSSPYHGLYKFKTGFGAAKRLCIGGRKILRPMVVTMNTQLRSLLKRIPGPTI